MAARGTGLGREGALGTAPCGPDAEGEAGLTPISFRSQETLASQKMISSFVISQLLDESKPEEKGAAVPVPRPAARPPAWPGKPAPASRRALALPPGPLGPPPPAAVSGPEPACAPGEEERPGGRGQKGFASITITARRVGPPARALAWGAAGDPPCTRCRAQDPQLRGPPALPSDADPGRHPGPPACTEAPGGSPVTRLCDGHRRWAASVGHGEDRRAPGRPGSGQRPLLFSSCVHLRVSRRCPSAPCSPDRPLCVPAEPAQPAGPQTHRSVLSLNLNCSSHGRTADGARGPASGGPISGGLKPQPQRAEGSGLLGRRWDPALHPAPGQVRLGAGACPWSGPPPTGSAALTEAGARQATSRTGKGDHGAPAHTGGQASAHANQLSIHIPGWSYRAGE